MASRGEEDRRKRPADNLLMRSVHAVRAEQVATLARARAVADQINLDLHVHYPPIGMPLLRGLKGSWMPYRFVGIAYEPRADSRDLCEFVHASEAD